MTPDSDPERDAIFVADYAKRGDAVAACVKAGIRDYRYDITVVAQRQLQRPEIAAAIATVKLLQPPPDAEITADSIVASLGSIHESAKEDRQYQAAIAALKLQAQLRGYLTTDINVTHRVDVSNMTDEALMKIAQRKTLAIEGEFTEIPKIGIANAGG